LTKKLRDKVIKEWEVRSLPDIVGFIEVHIAQGKKPPISPDVVSAISAVSLFESSKKIEKLTWALVFLTIILAILTLVLASRSLWQN